MMSFCRSISMPKGNRLPFFMITSKYVIELNSFGIEKRSCLEMKLVCAVDRTQGSGKIFMPFCATRSNHIRQNGSLSDKKRITISVSRTSLLNIFITEQNIHVQLPALKVFMVDVYALHIVQSDERSTS